MDVSVLPQVFCAILQKKRRKRTNQYLTSKEECKKIGLKTHRRQTGDNI